jgi:hypothetical protein
MGHVSEQQAVEVAREYASDECVGEFGEILGVTREGSNWIVEFRTHTFDDAYDHRVTITASVGNLIAHERLNHAN